MAFETGTASSHTDLYAKLIAFVTTDLLWTELGVTSPLSAANRIFVAPGLSGTEEIHFGLSYEANVGTDAYALRLWMFRAYNSALGNEGQPGHSGVGYHPVWNQPMTYWFIGNGQRLIIVTKVSTVYTATYVGKVLPYGVPGEWPQPYYVGGVYHNNARWSNTGNGFRNFWDTGNHGGARMLNPNGTWYTVGNLQWDFTSSEISANNSNYLWPYNSPYGGSSTSVMSRYRELRDNCDDSTYTLFPVVLTGVDPQTDLWGELDGVFAVPGFDAGSEDIITQDGDDHLLVQNVFRTARYYYAAVRLT